jgi:molybdopterin-guanine dinucleotide biosynthesis protein A
MAGGRSSRFGSDKLAASLGPGRLIDHVLARLGPWFEETVVVHAPSKSLADLPPGVRQTADEREGGGPLVGLVSGLAACRTEWGFAVAADMPFVRRELVDSLWARAADADVVVPIGPRGTEPLCAFYRASVLPFARGAVEAGKRRVISFFDEVRVTYMTEDEVRTVDPDLASFFNINTAADLTAAATTLAEPGHAPAEP